MRAGRMRIVLNGNAKMTRGKAAAQAVHAALMLLGVHPGTPVVVVGGKRADVEAMPIQVRDAGWTELAPGTLTAGAEWELDDLSQKRSQRAQELAQRIVDDTLLNLGAEVSPEVAEALRVLRQVAEHGLDHDALLRPGTEVSPEYELERIEDGGA
jgi:PTH2 family peptidyl-tRNA hydrolase